MFSTWQDPSNFASIALRFSTLRGTLYHLSSFLFSQSCSPFFSFLPFFLNFFIIFIYIFSRYGYKSSFSCFILLLCPIAPTFLGTLGTTGFKISWALKHTWSSWVISRRLTFSGLWKNLGHIVGWRNTLLLPNTSTPLQVTSNGWRMTWSGFCRMRRLTWRLARR